MKMSVRKRKKFLGNYVLVERNGKKYVRRYPKDYKAWNTERDLSKVHPNKIKTWVAFGKVAQKVRGKPYEEVIETFKKELSGKRFKPPRIPLTVPPEDYAGILLQAIERGISRRWIDILVRPEAKKPEEKKKIKRLKMLVRA